MGKQQRGKATGDETMAQPLQNAEILTNKYYQMHSVKSSQKRQEKIAEREQQMPKIHRANYRAAVSGRSRKAAIKAFCLECVAWEKEEVRLCTSLACPLYPYKPYKNRSN